jgi:murein DD-endopeptidase MepM/ murein hydrolase activator NlpD
MAAPAPTATEVPAPAQLAALPPSPTPPVAEVPPRTGRFIWPVKGRLVSGFGPAGKGLHNDGINIAAPLGTQVRAVDNGVVAYAGSELKGFGNLLLIKHAGGLTTAYAHNDKLLVSKGDVVKQGQVVATVGKTGNVEAPQLHFEVRQGTQAMDPQLYLQQANR